MLVYHFLRAKHVRSTLERKRLKVSLFPELNDPFELHAVDLGDSAKRARFRRWVRTLQARVGLVCFSRSWSNPVMWSHYADRHRGMCLAFDVRPSLLTEVSYVKSRAYEDLDRILASRGQTGALEQVLLRTKARGWSYEQEWRLLVCLGDLILDDGRYFRALGDGIELRQVLVGPRCPVGQTAIESALGEELVGKVEITKVRVAFRSFSVVENQQGFRHSPKMSWSAVS